VSRKRPTLSSKSIVTMSVIAVFAVAVAGLLVLSQPEKVPEAAAGVQRIRIETAAGEFSPDQVTAKAGSPIELEFPPGGSGCTASITFPDLGVAKDLTRGGIVALPALEAGTYAWKGGCGSESGALKVE
jgi:plastocyanin domain-containing protein